MAISFKDWKGVGSFGTVGLEVVLAIVLGVLGGRWLDGKFDTSPYITVVGFFFGVAAAVKAIIRVSREMQRETAREEREQGNPAPIYAYDDPKRDARPDEHVEPKPPPQSPDDNT